MTTTAALQPGAAPDYYASPVTDLGVKTAQSSPDQLAAAAARALQGNLAKEGAKLAAADKLFVRERLNLLLDPGSFVEDGLLVNALAPSNDLPADAEIACESPCFARYWRIYFFTTI